MSDSNPIRVLYMEDDAGLAQLLQKMLRQRGYVVDLAYNGADGLAMLEAGSYDVLLIDYVLPIHNGLEIIRMLASRGALPPTIVITGMSDEKVAVEAMKLGAANYIVKDIEMGYLELLPTVIKEALHKQQLVREKQQLFEAIRESEELNRALLSVIPDMMFQIGRDCTIRGFKPAKDFDSPMPPGEFLGKKIHEVMSPYHARQSMRRVKLALQTGDMQLFEYQIRTNNDTRDYEGRYVPCAKDEVLVIVRDITERKRAEEERERLLAAEREQRLLTETLREVTLTLTSQTSHEAVLDEILRQVQRLVPYGTAHIMLLEGDVLRIARWRGYQAFGNETLISNLVQRLADLPLDTEAVRSQKPLVAGDTRQEPRWIVFKESAWIRSHVTVPICHRDRVLGLLRLDSDTPGEFSAEDAERLRPLANAAAIALENARLYEQARQDAETKLTLLHEVNHRVKNNLAAIIGLLYAERRHTGMEDRPTYQAIMKDLISRIQGLATVHSLLSASEWTPLSLSELTTQVIHAALQALPPDKRVSVDVPPSRVRVTPKQANNLALVINELATNVVKYALSERDTTRITVTIALEDDLILLEFRDDGPGYLEDILQLERHHVGLYLIQTIVLDSLRGEFAFHNDHGAVATIRFKAEVAMNETESRQGTENDQTERSASLDR